MSPPPPPPPSPPPPPDSALSFSRSAPPSTRWSLRSPPHTPFSMASSPDNLTPSHHLSKKKVINGQQKKEELEREVSMLREMLDQEEKTREILERVHNNQHHGCTFNIPCSLPPKMKELLAELAMVEGEISRLEVQISHLQINLKQEQEETTRQARSREWQNSSYSINPPSLQSPIASKHPNYPPPSPIVSKGMNNNNNNGSSKDTIEKVGFETKALHFISKAIKGDYAMGGSNNANEKVGGSVNNLSGGGVFGEKENHRFQQENKFQDKINMKKSRMIKSPLHLREPRYSSPSPLRETRYSSPKPKERMALDTTIDLPPKSLSSTMLTEDGQNIHNWHPNKLAENIMKCLNFIYVRLLRTTRAMELEKTGPISRSTPFSLSSRSFRVDPTSSGSSKSTNLGLNKDSRQQDPYGIFDVEASLPRDIGPYKNLVIFTSSSMDPKCISSSSSVSLIQKLRVLMNNLETVDLRILNYHQKLSFWINMYNACVMHGFLQHGVPKTTEKMLGLINKATINVGGNTISARAIEHCILRRPAASNVNENYQRNEEERKETIIRKIYGVEPTDPNITFALSRGTRSSPAVRIYTAEGVTAELEKSKLEYLQASVVVTATKRIGLPELLVNHTHDFTRENSGASLVEWVCSQLPTSGSLRKSMVDCFRSHNNNNNHSGKASSSMMTTTMMTSSSSSANYSPVVEKIPYDFEFQYLLAI